MPPAWHQTGTPLAVHRRATVTVAAHGRDTGRAFIYAWRLRWPSRVRLKWIKMRQVGLSGCIFVDPHGSFTYFQGSPPKGFLASVLSVHQRNESTEPACMAWPTERAPQRPSCVFRACAGPLAVDFWPLRLCSSSPHSGAPAPSLVSHRATCQWPERRRERIRSEANTTI